MAAATESDDSPVSRKEKPSTSQSADSKDAENVRKSSRIKKPKKPASLLVQVQKKNLRRARSSSPESDREEKKKDKEKVEKPNAISPTKMTKKRLKKEVSSESEEEEVDKSSEESEDESINESFGLHMLNLRPVGSDLPQKEKSSIQLNARGMPRRICKKNPLFFDDNVVNVPSKTGKIKKMLNSSEVKKQMPKIKEKREKRKEEVPKPLTPEMSKEANAVRQRIGMKLRNLLKLPKAQRWVYYEWFYSNIDHVLFFGNNDFLLCAREAFSRLKTNTLTRMQWSFVRRVMGKPRRCSQSFFLEERKTLHRRRETIRKIQQRSCRDTAQCKDLPDKIPLQLRVNSRVSALLRRPQAGLFTGKVDAVDPSNHTYRITFDRVGLGTHSIPDYEVLFHGEPDMVSISGMHKRYVSHKQLQQSHSKLRWEAEPRESWEDNVVLMGGPFPKDFYEIMLRICKIIKVKRDQVDSLKTMNAEAEKIVSLGQDFPQEFQKRYASVVIDLESINISLYRYLNALQRRCHECAPDVCKQAMLAPSFIREKSISESKNIVSNYFKNKTPLKNKKLAELVTELVALIVQLQNLSPNKTSAHERLVLKQSIAKIKSMISPTNLLAFQNSVEVHLQYIEAKVATGTHLSPLLASTATK